MSQAYEEHKSSQSRNDIGYTIMICGVVASLIGVVFGTTPILQMVVDSVLYEAQRLSGIIGGIGATMVIYGMLLSIPDKSTIESRIGALGCFLCVLGVFWFGISFPFNWNIYNLTTVATAGFLYFIGILTLFGITFHAVVNYRMKSTEKFTITHRFESQSDNTNVQEEQQDNTKSSDQSKGGGIGVIGSLPPEARKTYGPRNPMTAEERQKHSLGSSNQKK